MKKTLFLMMLLFIGVTTISAQKQAEITFDKSVHDFGKFSELSPKVKCVFTFTNTGNAPLVINQATASCGCTATDYTQEPILPGKKGTINITYNGSGKYPGPFRKTITIRSNAKDELTKVYIKGDMTPKNEK